MAVFHVLATGDEHVVHQLRREQAVLDDSGGGTEERRERRGIVDGARIVGDDPAVGAARDIPQGNGLQVPIVAASPYSSISTGTVPRNAGTALLESAMTTNRSAAAATIFSLVWAAPPPLINHPSGVTSSAPSIAMSNRSMLAERRDGQSQRSGGLLRPR